MLTAAPELPSARVVYVFTPIWHGDSVTVPPPPHSEPIFIIHVESSQDGWRRLEYEEILAPAPPEEPGAGLVGGKESCEYSLPSSAHLPTNPCPLQLEEKKKLDQLRKEKEEERQLQELQRLQEEQTGKKRTEKLEWMYTTPATGSNQNANDLEDYLLGKKRVDKILTADDNVKVRPIPSLSVLFSDMWSSWELRTRISSPSRTLTLRETSPRKFARIRSLR